MFDKDASVTHAEITSLVALINSEYTRRNISIQLAPPSAQSLVDDAALDSLAAAVSTINQKHCNCEADSSYKNHTKTGTILALNASPVDEGVKLISSGAGPDIKDVETDIQRLSSQLACSSECKVVDYCSCFTYAQYTCGTYHTCNNLVCDCENDCSCDCDSDCSCDCDHSSCICVGFDSCNDDHCNCVGDYGCLN